MLNKLYTYLLYNFLKVNVPLPAFVANHAAFPPIGPLSPPTYGGDASPPMRKSV